MKKKSEQSEIKVSVIMSLYNVELFMRTAIESVLNQNLKEIELICINDGSTDYSLATAQEYADKDDRIKIITYDESKGQAYARNRGIDIARGKYIGFVDGDDWLVKQATEEFVNTALTFGCDMVISDFYRVCGRRIYTKGHIDAGPVITRMKYAEYMMEAPANFYYGVLWNKFFRADIIRTFALKCSLQLDWCEDFQFNLEYLQYVGKVGVIRKPLYYYVKTKGSLVDTQVNFQQSIRTKRILFDHYRDLYKAIDLYEENKLRIQMFYLSFAHDKTNKVKWIRSA